MSRDLIYLGMDRGYVRLALADLENLTPCTLPVKKVPRAEFNKLRKQVKVLGAVDSTTEITSNTYVRVAVVKFVAQQDKLIHVFISGAGKLRFLHPDFLKSITKDVHFLMRQNLVELPVASLLNVIPSDNCDAIYGDFFYYGSVPDGMTYFAQKLLSYGLMCSTSEFGYANVVPLDPTVQNVGNGYSAHIPSLYIPESCNNITFNLDDAPLFIADLYVYTTLNLYGNISHEARANGAKISMTVGTLHADGTTNVNIQDVILSKIEGKKASAKDLVVNSGSIKGLSKYSGSDMLKDAGLVSLIDCFSSDSCDIIEGDVLIPAWVSLYNCFDGVRIKGIVHCHKEVCMNTSFTEAECDGVLFDGECGVASIRDSAYVSNSFQNATILGDVDVQNTDRICGSFTGVIKGEVRLSPNLKELSKTCFTEAKDKNFMLNTVSDSFVAGLTCKGAVLNVTGNKGTFNEVNVAKLIWNTTLDVLCSGMFKGAEHIMSNEVASVTTIGSGAFIDYKGKLLDLRNFTALETIDTRAVNGCDNLMVAIIAGKTALKTSAFARSPRLAHIFIGDDVTSVPASSFDAVAPIIHIYYDKNKNVEKLGRIPRFKLHPNSTPDDAMAVLEERAERLETASVIAVFAGLSTDADASNQESVSIRHAVELSLGDVGMCDNLHERYPVMAKCSTPLSKVAWANKATKKTAHNISAEKVRTLVACVTATYPYCEAVLDYKPEKRAEIILASDDYVFICSTFSVSGELNWAYVIVDTTTNTIIHAFTVGLGRNEIAEIADYLNCLPENATSCSVLRYAEDVSLLSNDNKDFSAEVYLKLKQAVVASWLPFGSFKLGASNGIYGVDLFSGNCVVYPYRLKAGDGPYNHANKTAHNWMRVRLKEKGVLYSESIHANLKPMLAGTTDAELLRITLTSKLNNVTEYDTTRLPLARDLVKAGEFLGVLNGTKEDLSVKKFTELMLWSELFQKDARITNNSKFKYRSIAKTLRLTDGEVSLYNLEGTQLMAVQVIASNKELWYTAICGLPLIVNVLTHIVTSGTKVVDPDSNKAHYSLTDVFEDLSLDFLVSRISYIRSYVTEAEQLECLCLGVSTVSFKACLYWKRSEKNLPSAKNVAVVLWFNTLSDAYKALYEMEFVPYATTTHTKPAYRIRGGDVKFNACGSVVASAALVNTREAIMRGKPDNYIVPGNSKQLLFDLACKQPK